MTTFTPGPWTAHKNEVEGEVVIHGLPATFFVTSESERGGWVAEVMLDTTDEANARLIAAAPELLELVEAFERLANNLLARDTFSAADFETLKSALRFTAPQRHDVIAKAKGESNA